MNWNEIKIFLNRAYRLSRIKSILEREYRQKRKEVDNISISTEEIKVTTVVSKIEKKAIELVALENEIKHYSEQLEQVKSEIAMYINKVDDVILRKLLDLRYLEFKKWRDIEEILNYSEQHVHRLHNKALKEISKILKDVIAC